MAVGKEISARKSQRKTFKDFKKSGILFLAMVFLPSFIFLDMSEIFGEYALIKLLLVSGIGGGIGSVLSAENTREKLFALLPGMIMGTGVPLAIILYIILAGRESLFKFEVGVLAILGMGPGYLLRRLLIKSNLIYR